MTIGERIQKARKAAKLSQKELGDKLGVSASMIGQYENNLRKPKLNRLYSLANALNVYPSDLADLDETLMLGLGPMITIETEDGEFISLSADTQEAQLLNKYNMLNESGKKVALDRLNELLQIPKYQQPGYYYFYDESGELKKVMQKTEDE